MHWEQVGGDLRASKYGAVFGELDKLGDTVYGVYIVEVTDLIDACGEKEARVMGGAYLTSSSYVDVDNMPHKGIANILRSTGWVYRRREPDEPEAIPDEVKERMEYLRGCLSDYGKIRLWNGHDLSGKQAHEYRSMDLELDTYEHWYSMPRMWRAEAAHSYGGFTCSDTGEPGIFKTLAEAMDNHDIPASALNDPHEYDAPDPLIEDESDEQGA